MKERTILGVQMTTGVDLVISLFEVSLPPIHRIVQGNRGRQLLGEIDRFDISQSAIDDLILCELQRERERQKRLQRLGFAR
jgi:hypothetical protein